MGFEIKKANHPEYGDYGVGLVNGSIGKFGNAKAGREINSTIWGKNASSNLNKFLTTAYMKEEKPDGLFVAGYESQYSPVKDVKNSIFQEALLANAQADLNSGLVPTKDGKVSVEDFNKFGQQPFGKDVDVSVLDKNKDGVIDAKENAAFTLLADAMDEVDINKPIGDDNPIDLSKIDGKFTNKGQMAATGIIFGKTDKETKEFLVNKLHEKISDPQKETPIEGTPENNLKIKLNKGQGLGSLVLQNREALVKEYGTNKLWGEGGLVDQFAKANGFEGAADKKLNKIHFDKEYELKIKREDPNPEAENTQHHDT